MTMWNLKKKSFTVILIFDIDKDLEPQTETFVDPQLCGHSCGVELIELTQLI